jgi:DNA-binding beta-propeller fold protein YncE
MTERKNRRDHVRCLAIAVTFALGLVVKLAAQSAAPAAPPHITAGRNVNILGGKQALSLNPYEVRGDVLGRAQNEPSCAISTRNPQHILCGANDYRMVDVPGVTTTQIIRDAYLGVFQTANGGDTWESTLLGGFFLDPTPHPLKTFGAIAAADPIVRSGPAGMTFYGGIAFTKDRQNSALHVTAFADFNNIENDPMPFKAIRTTIVQQVASPKFIDKPWIFVEAASQSGLTCNVRATVVVNGVPRAVQQDVPASVIHVVYTIFQDSTDTTADIMYTKSENCGVNFTTPLRLTSVSHKKIDPGDDHSENGAAVSKALANGANRIYATWRRVERKDAAGNVIEPHALMISYSNNNGGSWSKPAVLTTICPFDQGTSAASFRTTVFPSITVDANGRVYVAWADRGRLANGQCNTLGAARIHVATSPDGSTWSSPVPVVPSAGGEHQIQPSLVFTAGRLFLAWMDFKCDASQVFDPRRVSEFDAANATLPRPPSPAADCTPPLLTAAHPVRHTGDIRAATALPGATPNFAGDTTMVSEYLKGVTVGSNGQKVQLQWNAVNRRWARKGTVPFNGDYIDIATMPYLPPDPDRGRKSWVPNNQSTIATSVGTVSVVPNVLIAWADNRDMRTPGVERRDVDGNPLDPVPYVTPAGFAKEQSWYDNTQTRLVCEVATDAYKTGTTNQNVYAARASAGWVAGSPGNNKGLGIIQRAFVVFVRNEDLRFSKTFKLVAYQPTGGVASFDQFDATKTTLDVVVPRKSSVSRTVFVSQKPNSSTKLDRDAVVRVDVVETVGTSPTQAIAIYLNSDPSAPEIDSPEIDSPEIDSTEIYTPEIDSPEIDSVSVRSPEIDSPEIDSPEIDSPEIDSAAWRTLGVQSPEIDSPEIDSPEIDSPEIDSPEIDSPEIDSSPIRDVTFKLTNAGNTTAQYGTKAFVAKASRKGDINYQIIVRQKYTVAAVNANCEPTTLTLSKVLINQLDVKLSTPEIDSPEIDSPEIDSSAFYVPPSESVDIIIRARGTESTLQTLTTQSFELAVQQEAVNTQDAAAGITEPPIITTFLSVTTTALPAGATGVPYSYRLAYSGGAAGPVTWSPTELLPPGLFLAPDGLISGTPTAAGTYVFTARVTDSAGEMASRDLAIVVTTPGTRSLAFVTQPSDTNIGEIITPAVSVRALDGTGSPVAGVPVTVALLGGATLSGAVTRSTGVTGIAVFDNLAITTAAQATGLQLGATATGYAAGTSVAFGITTPDLVVESLTHTPSEPTSADGSITATAVVTNIGGGGAGASKLMLQVAGETAGAPATLIDIPALMPGSSFTAQRSLATPGVGSYTHTAVADYTTQVSEANEANNSRTDDYSVSGAFVVTNTNDFGAGSLRQAMLNANATPGASAPQIFFAIPGAPPYVINVLTPLPAMTRPVVIDATTQPGWSGSPVVGLNGAGAGAGAHGIHLSGGSSTVRGLQIGAFRGHGILIDGPGANQVLGNFIGTNITGTAAMGNLGDGVRIDDSPNNLIGDIGWGNLISGNGSVSGPGNDGLVILNPSATGNIIRANLIGTNAAGTAAIPNLDFGVTIAIASGNTVGGSVATARNLISGNGSGLALYPSANSNVVTGNYIGTNAAGTTAIPNSVGIFIASNASNNTIGGSLATERNVIGGNGSGVTIQGSGNVVAGNNIGAGPDGLTPVPNATGILVSGNSNVIGSSSAGLDNRITGNTGNGIVVNAGTGNRIKGNAIYDNGRLGIDLGDDGVTPNDPGDTDTGANNLQNFPVITSATATQVAGTLNSSPNTVFTVELFTGVACDASGFGEFGALVGSAVVITDSSGFAPFAITPALTVEAFTTTATNESTGDTSEFSACAFMAAPPPAAVSNGLVSWWRADGNTLDSRGTNHGTLTNGATFASGISGQAFQLDGVNDYVDVGTGFNLDAMTLSAWVFVDPVTNTSERRVISKDNLLGGGARRTFALKSSSLAIPGPDGRPSFEVCVSVVADECTIGSHIDVVTAPSALTAGWHHLAGVRDYTAGRFELFVDGALAASVAPVNPGAVDSAANTVLGQVGPTSAGEFFSGRIDEAQIFSRALSTAEVLGLYNLGSSVVTAGSVPFGVAVNPNTGLAYVANRGNSTVSVIDYDNTHPAFGTVIANIIGFYGPLGVTVDTATNRVYVTNEADGGSVSVIDGDPDSGAFNSVIATLFVGGWASEGISADATNSHVWLGNYVGYTHTVINGLAGEGSSSPGCGVRGVAVNPVTHRVYLANSWCGGLLILDGDPANAAYRTQVGFVSGSSDVKGVAIDSVRNRVFAANAFGTLTAADGASGSILWSVSITGSPRHVAYSPATQLAYVTNFDGVLTIVDADPTSGTYQSILRTLLVGSSAGTTFETGRDGGDVPSVAVDLARGRVLVTNPADNTLTIFRDER